VLYSGEVAQGNGRRSMMHVDHDLADCDRTTSEMRGPSSRIQVGGILDEARMRKHTYKAHKDKIKVENVITTLFKDFKIRKQKLLQKIEYVCESVSLDGQGHSPHPRGEDLIQ
jgi:hypothetical protein